MASIVLINPWNFHDEGVRYTAEQLQRVWRNPPMGLVVLATELRDAGHEVTVCDLERDLVINGGNLRAALVDCRKLLECTQPDFVGITMLSVRYLEAEQIIRFCDEFRAAVGDRFRIVVGNIHPTVEPEMTLTDNPGVDIVFLGEADRPLVNLLDGQPVRQLPSVAFRDENRIIIKSPWCAPGLDDLPFPDWNFVDTTFYAAPNYAAHGRMTRAARSLDIATSRGCPYRCSFCVYNKTKYRSNSAEYVVRNIEYMLDRFDIDSIYFVDSSIGNNRRQLETICEILINRGLDERFRWSANMRSNQVDKELLKLMWRAGCRKLLYGFESGSQRVLDAMRKGCTVEQNETAARLQRELGFPYHASMILGFPGETIDDFEMTLRWLERVRPPIVGINTYVPLPGSEDYYRLKSTGKISVENPRIWRMIGEVNNPEAPVFCDVKPTVFWAYFNRIQRLAGELRDETQKSQAWKGA